MRKALAVSLVFCLAYAPFVESAAARGPSAAATPFAQDDSYQPSPYEAYSPEQLDNLLAPIALYPDPLLAQVLPAATFTDQIDQAARWVRAYGSNDVDSQPWDISVRAVAHYPTVLYMMADKLDWTTAVGQAYVNQSTDVMTSVQRLRAMAYSQGNLASTPQQQVVVEDPGYIQIVPAQPRYIFVPVYNPAVIFFRPASDVGVFGVVMGFSAGLVIGSWLNRDCDWDHHRVYYTGWQGRGWIERSRPYVNITNVYVNNRYTNVTVNRTVINRTVNVANINNYNSVHRNVTYDNHAGNRTFVNTNNRVNNQVINRNINTNDPRLDQYRGHENQGQPAPPPAQRPVPQASNRPVPPPPARPVPEASSRPVPPPAARPVPEASSRPVPPPPARPAVQPLSRPAAPQATQPQYQPGPHAFGRSEGGFDPRAASQRGQASRAEAMRPPSPPSTPRPAPNRPAPSSGGTRSSGKQR